MILQIASVCGQARALHPCNLGKLVNYKRVIHWDQRPISETAQGRLAFKCIRAIGAVVARFVHTEEVTGSNPVSPTSRSPSRQRNSSLEGLPCCAVCSLVVLSGGPPASRGSPRRLACRP